MDLKPIQHRLNEIGFGPLLEDSIPGARTSLAIKKFQFSKGLTPDGIPGPKTIQALGLVSETPAIVHPKGRMLTTAEIIKEYGEPGPQNLIVMDLPYPMRIEWAPGTFCRKIQFHKKAADRLHQVFVDILAAYGLEQIKALGIDLYAGAYNLRKMRGGSEWSRHSWGIATDLYSEKNLLHQHHDTALFATPPYQKMIECFYKNGFVGLGPEEDRDWMHFQVGS